MLAADTSDAIAVRRTRARRLVGLYAVTPDLPDIALLVSKARAALEGGAVALQYRNKGADAAHRHAQASALARMHAARGALFIVNDDAQLARAVDADGVHIGEDDASVTSAREIVGPDRIVGVSCYNDFERAATAVAQGADYVAFGSFFVSGTKPAAGVADVSLLSRARALGVPVVAIGGIRADNAASLIAAGADAVAVISDVFGHDDPSDVTGAAHAIARLFPVPHSSRHA